MNERERITAIPVCAYTSRDFMPESNFQLLPMSSKCLEINVSGLLNLSFRHFLKGTRTSSTNSMAGKGLKYAINQPTN